MNPPPYTGATLPQGMYATPYAPPMVQATPAMVECKHCRGKGNMDVWGTPCLRTDMHCRDTCCQCGGTGRVMAGSTVCTQCQGKGNFDVWGKPCESTSMHCKNACHLCNGRGIFSPVITMPQGMVMAPTQASPFVGRLFSSFSGRFAA